MVLSQMNVVAGGYQCDQIARLFFRFLAIYNENLSYSIKSWPKKVQNFAKYFINPQMLPKTLIFGQNGEYLPNLVTLVVTSNNKKIIPIFKNWIFHVRLFFFNFVF